MGVWSDLPHRGVCLSLPLPHGGSRDVTRQIRNLAQLIQSSVKWKGCGTSECVSVRKCVFWEDLSIWEVCVRIHACANGWSDLESCLADTAHSKVGNSADENGKKVQPYKSMMSVGWNSE